LRVQSAGKALYKCRTLAHTAIVKDPIIGIPLLGRGRAPANQLVNGASRWELVPRVLRQPLLIG